MIHQAIAEAYGRRGVAHISIPPDVFAAKAHRAVPSLATLRPRPEVAPAAADIAEGVADRGGRTVAVFCGAGCRGAANELKALADRLHAPLMHTYRGKELMAYDDPHWIGGVGLIGSRAGLDAVQDADLLLMLGTDYPYSDFLPKHGHVIQIDERAFALGRRAPIELGIVGSVKPALQQLVPQLATTPTAASSTRQQGPRRLGQDAGREGRPRPQGAHPSAGGGAARQRPGRPRRDLRHRHRRGDALGGQLAAAERPPAADRLAQQRRRRHGAGHRQRRADRSTATARSSCRCGDGGFTMLAGEFMTAVEHKLPIKVVVYDNAGWGLVHLEAKARPARRQGHQFPNLDFAAFAHACGGQGFKVDEPKAAADDRRGLGLRRPGDRRCGRGGR